MRKISSILIYKHNIQYIDYKNSEEKKSKLKQQSVKKIMKQKNRERKIKIETKNSEKKNQN